MHRPALSYLQAQNYTMQSHIMQELYSNVVHLLIYLFMQQLKTLHWLQFTDYGLLKNGQQRITKTQSSTDWQQKKMIMVCKNLSFKFNSNNTNDINISKKYSCSDNIKWFSCTGTRSKGHHTQQETWHSPWSTCARMQTLRMLAGFCCNVTSFCKSVLFIFFVSDNKYKGFHIKNSHCIQSYQSLWLWCGAF